MGSVPCRKPRCSPSRSAKAAARIGLTPLEFEELKEAADEARQRGYGVSLADWAQATNRDQHGRKKAQ
ncbi:MAG: hypothetical protein ACRDI2_04790 [Chloroflexota bacterium]